MNFNVTDSPFKTSGGTLTSSLPLSSFSGVKRTLPTGVSFAVTVSVEVFFMIEECVKFSRTTMRLTF